MGGPCRLTEASPRASTTYTRTSSSAAPPGDPPHATPNKFPMPGHFAKSAIPPPLRVIELPALEASLGSRRTPATMRPVSRLPCLPRFRTKGITYGEHTNKAQRRQYTAEAVSRARKEKDRCRKEREERDGRRHHEDDAIGAIALGCWRATDHIDATDHTHVGHTAVLMRVRHRQKLKQARTDHGVTYDCVSLGARMHVEVGVKV